MSDAKKTNAYMRMIFLLGFFGLSIGDAFNVLYAQDLARQIASPERLNFFVSLPITLMSAMMVVGVISANLMVQRDQDIVNFIRIATIVTAVGMLIRGLAFHYVLLILGFMVDGFGYGCYYIAIRYYAYLFSDDKKRLEAMAVIGGGSFAGQCLGTVLGGILAGQLPYRIVYLMALVPLMMPLVFLRKVKIDVPLVVGKLTDSLRVLKNRKAMRFLLFLVLPVFTCTVFVSYTVPLDANAFGYSPTMISAMLLGCYLIAAYAGPFMTRFVTARLSTLAAGILYCVGVAMLIAFYSLGRTFALLLVVVLLLGLMDSFGPSVLMDAYTKTGKGERYSDNDALVVYILVTRIGMTIAPTLIIVFETTRILSEFVILGLAIFLFMGVFVNLGKKETTK